MVDAEQVFVVALLLLFAAIPASALVAVWFGMSDGAAPVQYPESEFSGGLRGLEERLIFLITNIKLSDDHSDGIIHIRVLRDAGMPEHSKGWGSQDKFARSVMALRQLNPQDEAKMRLPSFSMYLTKSDPSSSTNDSSQPPIEDDPPQAPFRLYEETTQTVPQTEPLRVDVDLESGSECKNEVAETSNVASPAAEAESPARIASRVDATQGQNSGADSQIPPPLHPPPRHKALLKVPPPRMLRNGSGTRVTL